MPQLGDSRGHAWQVRLRRSRGGPVQLVGARGFFQTRGGGPCACWPRRWPILRASHAPSQRHWALAHGPRDVCEPSGRAHAFPSHVRPPDALASRHGPCGHRHADARGAAAGTGGPLPAGNGPRSFPCARLGMEGRKGRRDSGTAAADRGLLRLVTRAIYSERAHERGRGRGICTPAHHGPDLPRTAHGELEPRAANGRQRPGG
mmetsp:Transcript_71276/g.202093  ORF Transcript_71276/g.202093 Transcript_71276/m.202093 type:complete len:204 (+) Transcript_71276:436-1047(+)